MELGFGVARTHQRLAPINIRADRSTGIELQLSLTCILKECRLGQRESVRGRATGQFISRPAISGTSIDIWMQHEMAY